MSVFSVPVTIGVDEEAIAKSIESNVESQVVSAIVEKVENNVFTKRNYYDDDPLKQMVKSEVRNFISERENEIVKLAAEILADKLARSKAVKEVAAEVAKKTIK